MSASITTASPATTSEVAAQLLAYQSEQTGTPTDFNVGSQVRTLAENIGAIAEQQGVIAQALALQAMLYGACAAFGITPLGSQASAGSVVLMTGETAATSTPAQQTVAIAPGFILQTDGGVQFQTTATATLALGATGVSVPVQAVEPGSAGNISAGLVSTIVSNASYPLYVTNPLALTGGSDAETSGQTLSRLIAFVAGLGLGTPVGIAAFCIGITVGAETVRYATVYEPWLTQAQGSQTAGFQVYLDNGSGTASAALIAAVTAKLNGSAALALSGNRPAGVPYSVQAVTPVPWSVEVLAQLTDDTLEGTLTSAISAAVNLYQASLEFGADPEAAQLTAAVAGALQGYITSLQVSLLNSAGQAVSQVPVGATQRAILNTVTTTFS